MDNIEWLFKYLADNGVEVKLDTREDEGITVTVPMYGGEFAVHAESPDKAIAPIRKFHTRMSNDAVLLNNSGWTFDASSETWAKCVTQLFGNAEYVLRLRRHVIWLNNAPECRWQLCKYERGELKVVTERGSLTDIANALVYSMCDENGDLRRELLVIPEEYKG